MEICLLLVVLMMIKMTFKLEDIKIEGINENQSIIKNYSFTNKNNLSEDKTFCLFNNSCECEDVNFTEGENSFHYGHGCSPVAPDPYDH